MATYYMHTSDKSDVDTEGLQRKAIKKALAPEVQDAIQKIKFTTPNDLKTWKSVCRNVIMVALSIEEDVLDEQGIMKSVQTSGSAMTSLWDSKQLTVRKLLQDMRLNPSLRLLDAHLQSLLRNRLCPEFRVPSDEDSDASTEGGFTQRLESYSTFKFELAMATIVSNALHFKEIIQTTELDFVLHLINLAIMAATPTEDFPHPRASLIGIVLRSCTSLFGPNATEALGTWNMIFRYVIGNPFLFLLIHFLSKTVSLLYPEDPSEDDEDSPTSKYKFLRGWFVQTCELLSTLFNTEDFSIHGIPYLEKHRDDTQHFRDQLLGVLNTIKGLDTAQLAPIVYSFAPLSQSSANLRALLHSRALGEGRLLASLRGESGQSGLLQSPCPYLASSALKLPLIHAHTSHTPPLETVLMNPSTKLQELNASGALRTNLRSHCIAPGAQKLNTPSTPRVLYTRANDWTIASPERAPLRPTAGTELPKSMDEYLALRRRVRMLMDVCARISAK